MGEIFADDSAFGKVCNIMDANFTLSDASGGEAVALPLPITRKSVMKEGARLKVKLGACKDVKVCCHSSFNMKCGWCGLMAWSLLMVMVINSNYAALREKDCFQDGLDGERSAESEAD